MDGEEVYADKAATGGRHDEGAEGTEVVLTILRDSMPEPFDVKIMRQKIRLVSVKSDTLEGYRIHKDILDQKTYEDFKGQIKELQGGNKEPDTGFKRYPEA